MATPEQTTTPLPHPIRRMTINGGMLVLTLLLAALLSRPDGHLHVFFLEVPGDAVLIQVPGGGFVLIDGGSDPALLALQLGRHLPFYRRHLDAVVLTHSDGRRLPGAVAGLARYTVRRAIAPSRLSSRGTAGEWLRLTRAQGAAISVARPGERFRLGGIQLMVMAAGEGDEGGMALRLDYGVTSLLLHTGGGGLDEALLEVSRPVTALAYPWQRPLDTALVASLQPRLLVFTTAYEAEQPALLTTRERAAGHSAIYHPTLDGTIELVSDGRRMWVRTAH